jgi:hypothetical protein
VARLEIDDDFEAVGIPWWRYALPIVVLIVAVALISGLALSGAFGSGDRQLKQVAPSTTSSTVRITL